MGLSGPGCLVDNAGHRAPARVARDNWLNHGPSKQGPSHPGELVETADPGARARVTRDCW